MYEVIGYNKDCRNLNALEIGNKAYNLIKISKFYKLIPDFIVLPGKFVFEDNTKNITEDYIEKLRIKEELLNKIVSFFVLRKIRKVIIRSSFSKEDSLTKTFAGIFSSYIVDNVEDHKELENKIKLVYKKLFNRYVYEYANIPKGYLLCLDMSIIIQEFVEPEIGGVVIGIHNDFYGEFGLNSHNKVTSGRGYDFSLYYHKTKNMTLPFLYFLDKKDGFTAYKKVEVLVNEINVFLKKAEKYFSNHKNFDIEVIFCRNKVYIVQMRNLSFSLSDKNLYLNLNEILNIKRINKKRLAELHKVVNPIFESCGIGKIHFKEKNGLIAISLNSIKNVLELIDSNIKNTFFLNSIINKLFFKMVFDYLKFEAMKKKNKKLCYKQYRQLLFKGIYLLVTTDILFFFIKHYFKKNGFKPSLNIKHFLNEFPSEIRKIKDLILVFKRIKRKSLNEKLSFIMEFKTLIDIFYSNYLKKLMGYVIGKMNLSISTHDLLSLDPELIKDELIRSKCDDNSYLELDVVDSTNHNEKVKFFEGNIVVNKKFRGIAIKIDKCEAKHFGNINNYVIVADSIKAEYIPFILGAKAILTEDNNYASHAALIALELRKPCVIGLWGINSYVEDGDCIEFDGKLVKVDKGLKNQNKVSC